MYRAMHDSQMSPWNQELTICSGAKYLTCCNIRQWEAEVTRVRWSTDKNATQNQSRSNALGLWYPLGYRKPMQHITYVCSGQEPKEI